MASNKTKTQKNTKKEQPIAKEKNVQFLMLLICLALTLFVYVPTFNASFVNWDDDDYVVNNTSIQSLNHIQEIISKPVQGNYHPLTMFSLALNYTIFGKSATSFHITNVLLHLLNVCLVFFLFKKLSNGKNWPGFITALLFGIHPLHVESVAWVSERKDVLYAFFFLGGLLLYVNYIKSGKLVHLALVFVAFFLSIISKPAAVVLPLALLAIDYYYSRLFSIKTALEKIPFFILSLLFGLLTVNAQSQQGAVFAATVFPATSRFLFGNYGVLMYLAKTIVPINLCTFYPFPAINIALPTSYLISPLLSIGLIALILIYFKKNKVIVFSILFYLLNLILVLQFFPVGSAILADRYSYLPLLGPFFLLGYAMQRWVDKNNGKAPIALYLTVTLIVLTITPIAYTQVKTWKNSTALWDHAIVAVPSSRAYGQRGKIYKAEKNYTKAIEMYDISLSINKAETEDLLNRGNIWFILEKYRKALDDYNKCYGIKPNFPKLLENRGGAYAQLGLLDSALTDFNKAIELNPKTENGYLSRGLVYDRMNKENDAIVDLQKHLTIVNDNSGNIWNLIGTCYQKIDNYEASIISFSKAIESTPNPSFYYNRAISYNHLKGKITRI